MTPRIESHMRKNNGTNTVEPNEFTDFEKFELERPKTTKTRKAGSKPSTWLPPGGLSERFTAKHARQKKNTKFMKTTPNPIVRTHVSAVNSILTMPDAQNNYQFQKINIFKIFKKIRPKSPRMTNLDVKPAVNRQPGYRRVDS